MCASWLPRTQVGFSLNGVDMGVAFRGVLVLEPHLAYFPAVSLSQGESCSVNLGAQPLRYPTPGFRPLLDAVAPHVPHQCSRLLQHVTSLATVRITPAMSTSA